jgi:hypothetical protein
VIGVLWMGLVMIWKFTILGGSLQVLVRKNIGWGCMPRGCLWETDGCGDQKEAGGSTACHQQKSSGCDRIQDNEKTKARNRHERCNPKFSTLQKITTISNQQQKRHFELFPERPQTRDVAHFTTWMVYV